MFGGIVRRTNSEIRVRWVSRRRMLEKEEIRVKGVRILGVFGLLLVMSNINRKVLSRRVII